MSSDPGDRQPQYGEPGYGQPAYGQPTADQPAYGQPAYGQPMADQPAYGQPTPDQPGYGQPAYGQPSYGVPAYGQPDYGQPPAGYGQPAFPASQKTNTMAILSLIFAFVFSILGVVFGLIAKKQIRERGEGGGGLATAGIIVGLVFTVIWILGIVGISVAISHGGNSTTSGLFALPRWLSTLS